MDKPLPKFDIKNTDFFALLAQGATETRHTLVLSLLQLANEGDPAALRLLEKALVEAKPQQEKNRPIPILGGITQNYAENTKGKA